MKFVTLLEGAKNVHLMKGVGQIPYQMHKRYGYDSRIVCFNNGPYTYLSRELNGLKQTFLRRFFGFRAKYPATVLFLLNEAAGIDILHLTHIKKRTILYGLWYLFLNPQGILYYKLDDPHGKVTFRLGSLPGPLRGIVKRLGQTALRRCSLVSVETRFALRGVGKILAGKAILVPNAVDEDHVVNCGIRVRPCVEKDETVLLVGRHGQRSKNSELMLKALENMEPGPWKFVFAGKCGPRFVSARETLLGRRPDLAQKVILTGYIERKRELYELYNSARIICLPSRSEGCPNVVVEAIYFGVVPLMTSHLPAAWDLTDGGNAGVMFDSDDVEQLRAALSRLMADSEDLERRYERCMALARRDYVWGRIAARIHDGIRQAGRSAP